MNTREAFSLHCDLKAGLVHAIVFDGYAEVERLTLDKLDGRKGVLLSSVPLEFRPAWIA